MSLQSETRQIESMLGEKDHGSNGIQLEFETLQTDTTLTPADLTNPQCLLYSMLLTLGSTFCDPPT